MTTIELSPTTIGMLVRQQRRLLRALGTPIPLRRMAAITYSSTALAMSLPAGSAISAGHTFRFDDRLMTAGIAAGPAAAVTLVYRLLAAWVLIPVGYVVLLVARR